MARRSAVFVVALLLVGAPSAVQLCELRCADVASSAPDASARAARGCHDSGSAQATLLDSGPHVCGHDETLLQSANGMPVMPVWPALGIVATPAAPSRDHTALWQVVVRDDASPPHPLIVTQQLRI